jgi:hypothetical protein
MEDSTSNYLIIGNNLSNPNTNMVENTNEFKLFTNLQMIWTNEKLCKELLQYDENIINAVMTKIEIRVKIF